MEIKVVFVDIDGVFNTFRPFINKRSEVMVDDLMLPFYRLQLIKLSLLLNKHRLIKLNNLLHKIFWKELLIDIGFDPYSFHWLKKMLLSDDKVMIVISSVWRKGGIKKMRKILSLYGIPPERVIGSTILSKSGYRGLEIDAWLNGTDFCWDTLKRRQHSYVVEKFVILDDDADMEPHMSKLVMTDSYDGFGHESYLKAMSILGIKP